MILGIDTSAGQCAVALLGGGVRLSRVERMERGHAERLFPMIRAILAEAGTGPGALTGIAVVTGPGSFTGIRVGVAAARGLALGSGVPVVGVGRAEALAHMAGEARARIVALATRGKLVAVQRWSVGCSLPDGPLELIDAGEAPFTLSPGDLLLGDGLENIPDGVDRSLEDGLPTPLVAADLFERGGPAVPLYLRAPDADLPRKAPPKRLVSPA